jgi:hypothetical protein
MACDEREEETAVLVAMLVATLDVDADEAGVDADEASGADVREPMLKGLIIAEIVVVVVVIAVAMATAGATEEKEAAITIVDVVVGGGTSEPIVVVVIIVGSFADGPRCQNHRCKLYKVFF